MLGLRGLYPFTPWPPLLGLRPKPPATLAPPVGLKPPTPRGAPLKTLATPVGPTAYTPLHPGHPFWANAAYTPLTPWPPTVLGFVCT